MLIQSPVRAKKGALCSEIEREKVVCIHSWTRNLARTMKETLRLSCHGFVVSLKDLREEELNFGVKH